jgi:hypothetical protein
MSDTPRTDAVVGDFDFPWSYSMEMLVRHAERLERELVAATGILGALVVEKGFSCDCGISDAIWDEVKNAALQAEADSAASTGSTSAGVSPKPAAAAPGMTPVDALLNDHRAGPSTERKLRYARKQLYQRTKPRMRKP